MFKKVVVIIFFALLIRLPAYSLEKVGMESLLDFDNYEIIYSDQREDGIMSFILKKKHGYGANMMLCKIDNSKLTPLNMGCFPFPLAED